LCCVLACLGREKGIHNHIFLCNMIMDKVHKAENFLDPI
jgi:hypothetical protein